MAASGVIRRTSSSPRRRPALARPSARLVTGAGNEVRVRHPRRARAGRARVRGEPADGRRRDRVSGGACHPGDRNADGEAAEADRERPSGRRAREANLGREKSVVVAVDRPLDAGRDARSRRRGCPHVRGRQGGLDRIAVVTFGSSAVQATGFSTGTFEARSALSSLAVDRVQGTALRRGRACRTGARRRHDRRPRPRPAHRRRRRLERGLARLGDLRSARGGGAVYPIGLESKSFDPAPLRRLAKQTGGRYTGADASTSPPSTSLAAELRRTWQPRT